MEHEQGEHDLFVWSMAKIKWARSALAHSFTPASRCSSGSLSRMRRANSPGSRMLRSSATFASRAASA